MTRPILPTERAFRADLWRPDWTVAEHRDPKRLWLDKNENADPEMADVVKDAVVNVPGQAYFSYPDLAPLYEKLSKHTGVMSKNLLLSNGSDGCIRAVFEAFVSPGDVVIHSNPTFAMYGVYCEMFGARAFTQDYSPSGNGPVLDFEKMIDAIRTERPVLTCLPNPDSPTGTIVPHDSLRALIDVALDVGSMVLVDEAYYPFFPETLLPWIDEYPNLVITRSTGKAWGLAGFRIGYAAAAEDVISALQKLRPMYEVGAFSAAVFENMLDRESDMHASVRRLNEGKDYFLEAMCGLGFFTIGGHGNFCHVAFEDLAPRIHTALDGRVYYRKDFGHPCLKGLSRFSTTTVRRFKSVVEIIKSAVDS